MVIDILYCIYTSVIDKIYTDIMKTSQLEQFILKTIKLTKMYPLNKDIILYKVQIMVEFACVNQFCKLIIMQRLP